MTPSQHRHTPWPTTNRPQPARYALVAALYKEQLGDQIKRRREELDLTQAELATLAHVKESTTVSRWERGERSPNDLEAVARALQTTASEMLRELGAVPQANRRKMLPGGATQLDRLEGKVDELLLKLAALELAAAAQPPEPTTAGTPADAVGSGQTA